MLPIRKFSPRTAPGYHYSIVNILTFCLHYCITYVDGVNRFVVRTPNNVLKLIVYRRIVNHNTIEVNFVKKTEGLEI